MLAIHRSLANQAREIAENRNVLYHGTRYPSLILNTGIILRCPPGCFAVSFTRSPEVGADFAMLERDDDEGRGAILIFDRESLRHRYRIEPFCSIGRTGRFSEMEEIIREDLIDVGRHLIGLVTTPGIYRPQRVKQLNRRHRLRLSSLNRKVRDRVRGSAPEQVFARELAECLRTDRQKLEAARVLFFSHRLL